MLDLELYTVAVHDLDASAEAYKKMFGMQELRRFHNPIGDFDAVAMAYDGRNILNLIHPSNENAPLARFMKERSNPLNPHGEGVYMVAYQTDDVEAFAKQVEDGGGKITRRPGVSEFVWVHPTVANFVFMEIRPRSQPSS